MDLEIFASKFDVDTDKEQLDAILKWADHFEGEGEWPGVFGGYPYFLTPGELFDRYTIIAIKAKRLSDRAKANLMLRRATQLVRGLLPPDVNFVELHQRRWMARVKNAATLLQKVNDALWRVEDHLRDAEMAVFPDDAHSSSDTDWDLDADPPREFEAPHLAVETVDAENLPLILMFTHFSRMVCRLNRLRMSVKKHIDELFAQMPEPKDYRGELEE